MKKNIYLIPALGETCDELPYKKLSAGLEKKGYNVILVNPDWYEPITGQIFPVEKSAKIIGFSFGALIAYLTAKKYPCEKVILASLSPIESFTYDSLVEDMLPYMKRERAEELARDAKQIHTDLPIQAQQVRMAGALEDVGAVDVVVPGTGHELNDAYIGAILAQV